MKPPIPWKGVIAATVVTLLLILLFIVPGAVKAAGVPFLFIPEKLGLIERVSREEVQRVSLLEASPTVQIDAPGRYHVYSSDVNLLIAKESAEEPWLGVHRCSTGQAVPVDFVESGLRPYDSPIVKGRPLFVFDAPVPGAYGFSHALNEIDVEPRIFEMLLRQPRDGDGILSVVPAYTRGKETAITFFILLEIGLIVGPVGFVYLRQHLQRRRAWKAVQDEKRQQSDDFWQAMMREKNGGSEEARD
jgi:hypothetical protein